MSEPAPFQQSPPAKALRWPWVVLIAVLLLLAAGGGVYYWQKLQPLVYEPPENQPPAPSGVEGPTPTDPTVNWKTYRNEQYGFEFKYPGHYYLGSNDYGNRDVTKSSTVMIQDPQSPLVTDPTNNITHKKRINISVVGKGDVVSLRQYVESNYTISELYGYPTSQVRQTIFAGKEAYEFTFNHGFQGERGGRLIYPEHRGIWVMINDRIYSISYPTDEPTFDQILSAFRFIR